jgi:hypothetical protein
MIMFANNPRALMIVFINRSVIFATVLKSMSFGSVGRRMTNKMVFVLMPWVLIASAVIVRRFPVSVAPVMFSADMLIPVPFVMPVISAIRPGCTCKKKKYHCRHHTNFQ